jgi:2-(1,2-epoxy-1,2-dihydrophenyl)acetyl-CoA isomerase
MSDREKLARTLYDALAAGDAGALGELLHPDFVGETTEGLPLDLGGRHTGPEAMTQDFWWAIGRHYRARAEPERMLPLADGGLVVLGRYTGSARDGGAPLDAAFAHVLAFADDDRIVGLAQYTDSARWAAALPSPPAGERPLRVVEYTVDGGVATVRLNRPHAGNAIDPTMVEDLYEASFRAGADPTVRAVLICGAGRNLSVGGDLPFFAGTDDADRGARLRQMTDLYHLALDRFASLEVPVVCAVRGAAAGGGMGLAHVADIVVAAEDAAFALGYAAIGLAIDGANSWYLPRVVGMRRAQEMFLLNRRLDGREALEWGLVTEVLPADEVEARARALADRLAAGPTAAFGRMRRLLRQSWRTELSEQLVAETDEMSRAGTTVDAGEGIRAFVAKRRPEFHGR